MNLIWRTLRSSAKSVVEFFDDKLPNEIVKFLRLDESVSNIK